MPNAKTLTKRLADNAFQEILARLYCCSVEETDIYSERFRDLLTAYAGHFGESESIGLFSAPGRTEIGGNHTDHQNGCILAGSVNLDIVAAAAPNGTDTVRMVSDGQPLETVDLSNLRPDSEEFFTSASLIRGIAAQFMREGYRIAGFDVECTSTVLKGSGLSSSAAFEVLIGAIFNGLFCEGRVSALELAKFGKYAENVFFGKASGLMDQLASAVGGIMLADFDRQPDPVVEKIELDLASYGYALCIIDSGADHSNLSDIYSSIPYEMGRVAAFFDKTLLREVDYFDLINNLPKVRKAVGDRAVLRALHFFADSQRAVDEAAALKAGQFDEFLTLVNESGRSSAMYLQNTHVPGADREQAVDITQALCGEILRGRGAYRVHGGGFAGTVQAFIPIDMLDSFTLEIEAALGQRSCHVLSIRPDGGVRLA